VIAEFFYGCGPRQPSRARGCAGKLADDGPGSCSARCGRRFVVRCAWLADGVLEPGKGENLAHYLLSIDGTRFLLQRLVDPCRPGIMSSSFRRDGRGGLIAQGEGGIVFAEGTDRGRRNLQSLIAETEKNGPWPGSTMTDGLEQTVLCHPIKASADPSEKIVSGIFPTTSGPSSGSKDRGKGAKL